MMELDWKGIAELLDKFPEGMLIGGEAKVSIPNTDICKIEFVSMKQDGDYYHIITDLLSINDMINSMIRVKLTNMLLAIMAEEYNNIQSNKYVDYSKEKEAIARVIKLLDDFEEK